MSYWTWNARVLRMWLRKNYSSQSLWTFISIGILNRKRTLSKTNFIIEISNLGFQLKIGVKYFKNYFRPLRVALKKILCHSMQLDEFYLPMKDCPFCTMSDNVRGQIPNSGSGFDFFKIWAKIRNQHNFLL